jgi:cytoskeletal protein CcmA (bactofilin family)
LWQDDLKAPLSPKELSTSIPRGRCIYPEGEVKGKVKAKDLTVAGRIQGEIEVTNRLRVKNSATLEANISTRFLDWEEGAELEGEVHTFY